MPKFADMSTVIWSDADTFIGTAICSFCPETVTLTAGVPSTRIAPGII